jgi:sphingolipid 4-desaturase/C4-monooxygenase
MSSAPTDFVHSTEPEPHRGRTRAILRAHPEIRQLLGRRNPWTFQVILLAVGLQLSVAYAVKDMEFGWILAAAYLLGAFASHTLFVCIHEAAHHLIFRGVKPNLAAALVANLPSLVPTALSFRHFHLKHHAFQGVEELDADLPSRWEARLIGSGFPGKATWLLLFPIFQTLRTLRTREVGAFDKWAVLNIVVQVAFTYSIYLTMGPGALIYLLASFWFSVGLHPLGARWIQEHYLVLDENQETYSYYGPLNSINLNVGYHNEHHDFPSVPWNLLPEIKRLAPEYYEPLLAHNSMMKLFLQFLFEQEISLFCRVVRLRPADARKLLKPGLYVPEKDV